MNVVNLGTCLQFQEQINCLKVFFIDSICMTTNYTQRLFSVSQSDLAHKNRQFLNSRNKKKQIDARFCENCYLGLFLFVLTTLLDNVEFWASLVFRVGNRCPCLGKKIDVNKMFHVAINCFHRHNYVGLYRSKKTMNTGASLKSFFPIGRYITHVMLKISLNCLFIGP